MEIYKDLGFKDVILKYSDRPEQRVGDDSIWDKKVAKQKASAKANQKPEELSITKLTSARPRAGRSGVPANTTSSIFPDRTVVGPWAPKTHAMASTTFDLPLPFGPTTTVTPGSNSSRVGSAKDLKPFIVSDLRNTEFDLPGKRKRH